MAMTQALLFLAAYAPYVPATSATATSAADSTTVLPGESIYRDGRLGSGVSLRAGRNGDVIQGAAAACVNCHRRSGLGSYEGSILVPPIIGPYLFRQGAMNAGDLALPHISGYTPNRYAYTDKSAARAIRAGIAPDGRTLNALMPRYALDDTSMAELLGYLKQLSAGPFPGVNERTLEFATIVTPDADPLERAAMLAVLENYFKVRNAAIAPQGSWPRQAAAAEYHVARNWRLQVWELSGPPETWEQQLQRHQAAEPVFAVVSGVGRTTWSPVHRFCEHNHVPCLLPNLDLPPVLEKNYYPMYFSRGVLLEGELILARLRSSSAPLPLPLPLPPPQDAARILQIYRAGDIGEAAAAALAERAQITGHPVTNRMLPPRGSAPRGSQSGDAAAEPERRARIELADALADAAPQDILVLWLRPEDVAALGERAPSTQIYLSGAMAGLEDAPLPALWRRSIRMTYPYDLPELRRVRENFPHAWLRAHGIALTADRLQSNTYLTCTIVADALDGMLDSFVPDFLVERLEGMLGTRLSTGYFPRLTLASGQRFASKGGFIVRFEQHDPARVVADGEWLVP